MADSKSRADIQAELEQTLAIKAVAEDRLAEDRLSPIVERLSVARAEYKELEEQYGHAVASRNVLEAELNEALAASDDSETINEEIQDTEALITSINEQIDQNMAQIVEVRAATEEIKAEYDVRAEELEMAKLNNEHTRLLERRLEVMESRFNGLVDELRQFEILNNVLTGQLQEATEARDSSEYILEDVESRLVTISELNAQIASLSDTIEEKRQVLEAYFDNIEELKEAFEITSAEIAADNAVVNSQTAKASGLKEQFDNYQEPAAPVNEDVADLLNKIEKCIDYQNLYALERDFNKNGLTVQTTSNNRMVLCKLQESQIVAENVIDDYIFIGSLDKATSELSNRAIEKIKGFVAASSGAPSEFKNAPRVWRNGLHMYESSVTIVNEDKKFAVDVLVESERVI